MALLLLVLPFLYSLSLGESMVLEWVFDLLLILGMRMVCVVRIGMKGMYGLLECIVISCSAMTLLPQ